MSYTELKAIHKDGSIVGLKEFRNSWGFAARVWDTLAQKYFGWKSQEWLIKNGGGRDVWALHEDPRLSPSDRITLLSTFDYAIIEPEHTSDVVAAYRQFVNDNPPGEYCCHLSEIAAEMEKIDTSDLIGLCFYPMSVAEDVWNRWDEEADESKPYDLVTGDKHFFIFAEPSLAPPATPA